MKYKIKRALSIMFYLALLVALFYFIYFITTTHRKRVLEQSNKVVLNDIKEVYYNRKFKCLDLDITNFKESSTYISVEIEGIMERIKVNPNQTLGSVALDKPVTTLPYQTDLLIYVGEDKFAKKIIIKER